jgi:hypothetical protein
LHTSRICLSPHLLEELLQAAGPHTIQIRLRRSQLHLLRARLRSCRLLPQPLLLFRLPLLLRFLCGPSHRLLLPRLLLRPPLRLLHTAPLLFLLLRLLSRRCFCCCCPSFFFLLCALLVPLLEPLQLLCRALRCCCSCCGISLKRFLGGSIGGVSKRFFFSFLAGSSSAGTGLLALVESVRHEGLRRLVLRSTISLLCLLLLLLGLVCLLGLLGLLCRARRWLRWCECLRLLGTRGPSSTSTSLFT